MWQSLFFNKVAGACIFIKKETLAQVFSCEFYEISKNTSGGCFCILYVVEEKLQQSKLKS